MTVKDGETFASGVLSEKAHYMDVFEICFSP